MANAITDTLDNLATIVGAVSGIDNRIHQGYIRFSATQNYEDMITALTPYTQGYFDFWFLESTLGIRGDPATFNVAGELHVYVPKETSDDLNSPIELATNVRNAIMTPANWSTSGLCMPTICTFRFVGVNVTHTPGVATFAFGGDNGGNMTFLGGCETK